MITNEITPRAHRGRRRCAVCRKPVPPKRRCVCEMGAEQEDLDKALVEARQEASLAPLVETCDPEDRIQTVRDAAGGRRSLRMSLTEIITVIVLAVLVVLIFASGPAAVDQTMARQEEQSRTGQEVQFDRP